MFIMRNGSCVRCSIHLNRRMTTLLHKSTLTIFLILLNENTCDFRSIFSFFYPQRVYFMYFKKKRKKNLNLLEKQSVSFSSSFFFFPDITNEMTRQTSFLQTQSFYLSPGNTQCPIPIFSCQRFCIYFSSFYPISGTQEQ